MHSLSICLFHILFSPHFFDWSISTKANAFLNRNIYIYILANKQPLNPQQLPTRSKNTFLQCNQPCHKSRCKLGSHFDTRCSIKFDNNFTISVAKADCDSQKVVFILFCAKCPNAAYVGETSNRLRLRLNNHKHSIKHNFSGYPVAMVTP